MSIYIFKNKSFEKYLYFNPSMTVIYICSTRLMIVSFLSPMDITPDHWDQGKSLKIMTTDSFLVRFPWEWEWIWQKTLRFQPQGHKRPFHFQRVVAIYSFNIWVLKKSQTWFFFDNHYLIFCNETAIFLRHPCILPILISKHKPTPSSSKWVLLFRNSFIP